LGFPAELEREHAEAAVAVGNERAHTASLSEYERFTVVGLAALSIAPVGMRRDVAEQVLSMGREPGLTYKRFNCALTQTPRLVEPAEQQTGATERLVHLATMAEEASRLLTLEQLLAFLGTCSQGRGNRQGLVLRDPAQIRPLLFEETCNCLDQHGQCRPTP